MIQLESAFTLMPGDVDGFAVRSFGSKVPDGMPGYIWTNQLLHHVQESLIGPEITERLRPTRDRM